MSTTNGASFAIRGRRLVVMGACVAIAAGGASAMPEWQKRVLIGKVVPAMTEAGFALKPGTGFACKRVDLTQPLATQSQPDACDALSVQVYFKDQGKLYPGPTMTGTLGEGVSADWTAWTDAYLGWRDTRMDKERPMAVYTTPLEGGCKPKLAAEAPAVDTAGEACLSPHGTYTIPLWPVAFAYLEHQLTTQVDMLKPVMGSLPVYVGLCPTADENQGMLGGCTNLRHMLSIAKAGETPLPDDPLVAQRDCQPPQPRYLKNAEALYALEQEGIVYALGTLTGDISDTPAYQLLKTRLKELRPADAAAAQCQQREGYWGDHWGPEAATRARPIVSRSAVARFDAAVKSGDLDAADRWLKDAEEVDGAKPHAAQRQRLTALVRAKEARDAADAARKAAADRACQAGCMQLVVACDENPPICGGQCNGSSLCPCCHPSVNDCRSGGTYRFAYNATHASCR